MEFYFDTEVTVDAETREAERRGERVSLSPANCSIITMQFQLLDRGGRPASPLIVKRVWETEGGEKAMLNEFFHEHLSANPWDFIPVGCNVLFDIGMLLGRAKALGVGAPEHWEFYHQRPHIDIKHVLLGMNNFAFKDSGLDKFTGKGMSGKNVPIWYEDARTGKDPHGYAKIDQYVEHEAEEFVELYAKLKAELPKLRKQMGLFATKKEEEPELV